VKRTTDPFDVRLVMAEKSPEKLSGIARETAQNASTSAIIRNMTKPRYASREVSRPLTSGAGEALMVLYFVVECVATFGIKHWNIRKRRASPDKLALDRFCALRASHEPKGL
jgi:hypothetical protein